MCPSLGGCPTVEKASPGCREVRYCELLRPNGVLRSSLEGYDTGTLVACTGRIPGSMLQPSRGERTLREGVGSLPEQRCIGNVPATSGGIPVRLRRLVLLGTPLVLGILEIWHPTSSESPFDLIVDKANWWFTLHLLQLPLFGLMALAVYLLVDGLHGWAATISRIGAWFFVVFYIALDSILGIAGGVIARGARELPADQQALIARELEKFAFDPIVGGGGLSLLGILGPLGWVAAAVGAAIALRRVGLPVVPTILIGASAIFAVHSWPTGSLGLAFFLLGAGWAEFIREKAVVGGPTDA